MNVLKTLDEVENQPADLIPHSADERILLRCEGEGLYPAHKYRSFAYVVRRALEAGVRIKRICDRSSGSWAMAGSYIGSRLGIDTLWVTASLPSPEVKNYVERHGGKFDLVDSNELRIVRVEALQREGWWCPDQHNNDIVIEAFAETLGKQLAIQLDASGLSIRYLVAPVGTGGMLAGVSRTLRKAGYHFETIGVDRTSGITNGTALSWKESRFGLRGVGSDDEFCRTYRTARKEIDELLVANEFEAAQVMLDYQESPRGCGMSGALTLHATFANILSRCGQGDNILVLIPDSGASYSAQRAYASQLYQVANNI